MQQLLFILMCFLSINFKFVKRNIVENVKNANFVYHCCVNYIHKTLFSEYTNMITMGLFPKPFIIEM